MGAVKNQLHEWREEHNEIMNRLGYLTYITAYWRKRMYDMNLTQEERLEAQSEWSDDMIILNEYLTRLFELDDLLLKLGGTVPATEEGYEL